MAITFPLSLNAFMRDLGIVTATFAIPTQRQITNLAGGEIISSEVSTALWQGEFSIAPMTREDGGGVAALLAELEVPGRAFRVYDPARPAPLMDPTGSGISGASPVVSASTANTITLSAMPNGYVISPGDYVSFTYNTTRRALHRFVEGATVSGGTTGALQVQPHVRATVPASAPATLKEAWCYAVTVPGSVNFGEYSGLHLFNASFAFRQTLRA